MSWLDEVNKLKKENPDAELRFVISEDNFDESNAIYCSDACVYLNNMILFGGKFVDEEEYLKELISEDLISEHPEMMEWSDENLENQIDNRFEELKSGWKKYIVMSII